MILRRTWVVLCCSAVIAMMATAAFGQDIIISEIDYDQPSTDTAEWVELWNPSPVDAPLTGLELVVKNGSLSGSCASACTIDLDPYTIPAGGYIVFGEHPCATAPLCGNNSIQNGAPDAVIVQERDSGFVVDSVEYESNLVDSVCNFFMTDAEDNGDGSIQLCPNEWIFNTVSTPCMPNDCPIANQQSTWGALKGLY